MSAKTFAEWQAYSQIEPFGPFAQFWMAGMVASTLANLHRTKKSDKVYSPEDFMPKGMVQREVSEEDREHMARVIKDRFQSHNDLLKLREAHGQQNRA